jgi:hypothetical protein
MAAYLIEGLSILLSPVCAGIAPYHVGDVPILYEAVPSTDRVLDLAAG